MPNITHDRLRELLTELWLQRAGEAGAPLMTFDESAYLSAMKITHCGELTTAGSELLDTTSSASRQHYIDTGLYLLVGEAEETCK